MKKLSGRGHQRISRGRHAARKVFSKNGTSYNGLTSKGNFIFVFQEKYMLRIGLANFEPCVRTVNTEYTQCAVKIVRCHRVTPSAGCLLDASPQRGSFTCLMTQLPSASKSTYGELKYETRRPWWFPLFQVTPVENCFLKPLISLEIYCFEALQRSFAIKTNEHRRNCFTKQWHLRMSSEEPQMRWTGAHTGIVQRVGNALNKWTLSHICLVKRCFDGCASRVAWMGCMRVISVGRVIAEGKKLEPQNSRLRHHHPVALCKCSFLRHRVKRNETLPRW